MHQSHKMGNSKSTSEHTVSENFQILHKNLDNQSKELVHGAFVDEYDDKMINVLIKILSSKTLKKRVGQRMKEACVVFSQPDSLRELYLNTNWTAQLKAFEEKYKMSEIEKDEEEKGTSSTFSSKSTEIDTGLEEKLSEDLQEKYPELKMKFNNVRIKLVIGEVSHSQTSKTFRELVSPILSKMDLLPEFGMFHSALMIGPWMIDWNDSGICIPRKCVSQAALISADISNIGSEKKLDEVADKLAKIICKWNTQKLYKDQPPKGSHEGNCQDFILSILDELGIKVDFGGPLGLFMKKLKDKGKCLIEFEMDEEFREKFAIKEKIIHFKTHLELDQFVTKLKNIDVDFSDRYKNHWQLLKSFDRAFWLRSYKFSTDQKFQCLNQDGECRCPFGDPVQTGSIPVEED